MSSKDERAGSRSIPVISGCQKIKGHLRRIALVRPLDNGASGTKELQAPTFVLMLDTCHYIII